MAVTAETMNDHVTDPAVLVPVPSARRACGDCRHHMPRATAPGSWCAHPGASLSGKSVIATHDACADFSTWPENSRAAYLVEAIRF